MRASSRQRTSKSISKAQAFVSEEADLEVAIRCNAETIASATKMLAHGRDEPDSGTEKTNQCGQIRISKYGPCANVLDQACVYEIISKGSRQAAGESCILSTPVRWHSFLAAAALRPCTPGWIVRSEKYGRMNQHTGTSRKHLTLNA